MLRVALVGCGGMAWTYRKVYAQMPGVEFALAVDVNDVQLQHCLDLGAKRVSNRFVDALADDIDLIDISTPNHLHAEQAVAALDAGKHVVVQKPISNRLADADRIVDAAERSERFAGMFMSSYTNPLVWDLKRLIDGGGVGTVHTVHARDAHRGGLAAKPGVWRSDRDLTGGGSFIQLSIHAINLIQFWVGDHISTVRAITQNTLCPNIGGDDLTACIAHFSRGAVGTFVSGYASDGVERGIYGTKGRFILSNWDQKLEINLDEPFEGEIIKYTTPRKNMTIEYKVPAYDDVTNPYNGQRRFLESVLSNTPPTFNVLDGRNDLAVVDAVHQSAIRDGRPFHVFRRSPRPKLEATVYAASSRLQSA